MTTTHADSPRHVPATHRRRSEWVSATTIIDGKRFVVVAEIRPRPRRDRSYKGKAYVWNAPSPDMPTPEGEGTKRGVDVEIDKAWDTYNRAKIRNMRAALSAVLDGDWSFGRNLGCSCGCSPGFKIKPEHERKFWRKDVFIHVEPF